MLFINDCVSSLEKKMEEFSIIVYIAIFAKSISFSLSSF